MLEDGEELAEALKIGLAFKHITKNNVTDFRDNHGREAFWSERDLIDYYDKNMG